MAAVLTSEKCTQYVLCVRVMFIESIKAVLVVKCISVTPVNGLTVLKLLSASRTIIDCK